MQVLNKCNLSHRIFSFTTNLERKWDGHAHNEQKERHDKISEIAAIPWCMTNRWPFSSSIINQDHKLQSMFTSPKEVK